MNKLDIEKEYIIMCSIARFGYDAMPQDYAFLSRHSLLQFYYEMLNRKTTGRPTKDLDNLIKSEVEAAITECDLSHLRAYRKQHGNKETKLLFSNNDYYWKTFLVEIKKSNVHEHNQANTENAQTA